MKRNESRAYSGGQLRRAVAALIALSLFSGAFVALVSLAAVRRRELSLPATAVEAATGGRAATRRPLVRGRVPEAAAARRANDRPPVVSPPISRYQFAAELGARLAAAGVTVLRISPAASRGEGSPRSTVGFLYEVTGTPERILAFLRSLSSPRMPYVVDPLRLWVEERSLCAELTVRLGANEP